MGLSRTFVGFSSTDIHYYRLMLAWKENEHIDFNFANCQLGKEINSEDEAYIRRKCRERIDMAGTFAVLIGQDTRSKATLNKPSKISAQTWMTQFFGLLCLSRGPFGQFAGR